MAKNYLHDWKCSLCSNSANIIPYIYNTIAQWNKTCVATRKIVNKNINVIESPYPPFYFESLPEDIQKYICHLLDEKSLLNFSLCNKRINKYANDEKLWKARYLNLLSGTFCALVSYIQNVVASVHQKHSKGSLNLA